jgi:serine/threonine-protein kinase
MPLRIGDTFAGYRVLRLLGSGGMGEVYLVQHPRLPRQEALKVLRPEFSRDASFRERFIREADLASGLRHPHVVGIHDRGEQDGQLWIAMDFIEGTDLSQLVENRYPAGMPVRHVRAIATAVASALDRAHKKGLLHRDVKPANIIVADLDTDDPAVFLADFGIARPLDDTGGLTTTNMTVGTVAYAAPEQLMGEAMDGRADQYALGGTTFHLLTGSQPFPHSNPAVVISRHLNTNPPTLSDHRPDYAGLDEVLRKSLAKNASDRFSSCSAFAQALTNESLPAVASSNATTQKAPHRHRSIETNIATPSTQESPVKGSQLSWVVVASLAAVVILIGAVLLVWRPWDSRQTHSDGATSTPAAASFPSPKPHPPNPVGEARFVADVHTKIPTADIPGGRPTDTRLIAYGYQACDMMAVYPNPAAAAAPFYGQVSRDAGYTRDPATINNTSAGNEVFFMTIAAQNLCDATAPAPPPPVATTAPPTTTTAQVLSGPTIGDACSDWMKFATDSQTGQEMLCFGYPDNIDRGEPTTWFSTADGPVAGAADHPPVGKSGSPCSVPPFTFGKSSDGYSVWCFGGGEALMPGGRTFYTPESKPVWALYSP